MSYGLEVQNSAGAITIESTYKNYVLRETHTVTFAAGSGTNLYDVTLFNSDPEIDFNMNIDEAYYKILTFTNTFNETPLIGIISPDTAVALVSLDATKAYLLAERGLGTSTTATIYVFGPALSQTNPFGLVVNNASGNLVYSSQYNPLTIFSIIPLSMYGDGVEEDYGHPDINVNGSNLAAATWDTDFSNREISLTHASCGSLPILLLNPFLSCWWLTEQDSIGSLMYIGFKNVSNTVSKITSTCFSIDTYDLSNLPSSYEGGSNSFDGYSSSKPFGTVLALAKLY